MSRDLFFGPTDQREVIIEFLFTRRFLCPELSNYRINLHTEFHRESRIHISCHEFANSIIRDTEKHPGSSVTIRVIKKKFDNSQIRDIKKIRDIPDYPCEEIVTRDLDNYLLRHTI